MRKTNKISPDHGGGVPASGSPPNKAVSDAEYAVDIINNAIEEYFLRMRVIREAAEAETSKFLKFVYKEQILMMQLHIANLNNIAMSIRIYAEGLT